jgi:asparagine synthase (glutamine-hydrolysing)
VCGIFGELALSPDARGSVGAYLDASVDRIAHRGPDDRGTWTGDGVSLGVRRLSIIDLAGGHQPIWNEDASRCIVYNGELYNFQDIRPILEGRGHRFTTRTDTEVILHAHEEWGAECLRRFNGMFAFAIWDNRSRTLFLARDRIGEKPLYYYLDGRRLVFASEIKAILADPTILRALNPRGLDTFLTFGYSIAPETAYRDIRKLSPGHYLEVREGQVRIGRYWEVGDEPQLNDDAAPAGQADFEDRIVELLDDSVRRRLVADVPVGAFLSGGVDSSAVTALMRRHATERPKTFSVGFGIGGYDELADARRVAEHLGTDHHELEVRDADLVGILRTLVYHYDEPFGDPAGFPLYLLSRFAREHVKVVLTGDGGDELFGGYRRYAADQLAPLYQRLGASVGRTVVPAMVDRLPRLRRLKQAVRTLPIEDPARRYVSWLTVFGRDLQADLLSPDLRRSVLDHDPAAPHAAHYGRLNGHLAADHLNRLMYVDLKTLLADAYMEKTDKATMACSLEARLPMLDHRLVELSFEIPSSYKIRGLSTKRIFKRAVRDLVPESVRRKRKHGFEVPLDPWFRGPLKSFAFEVLLDPRARGRGYFNIPTIERLWKEHVGGRQVWDSQLWLLLNFELWHRIYLDGDGL